jgi:ATP-dependent DNA helicase RecG
MLSLSSSTKEISRVGDSTGKKLVNLGLETVHDLLLWLPFRYEDYSQVSLIKDLRAGQNANIVGVVELIQNSRSPKKRMHLTEALISDESGQIKIVWFNQPFITKALKEGDKVSLAGRVDRDYAGLSMVSPIHEKLAYGGAIHTQGLIPNYHLTAGITQKQLRFLMRQAIDLADKLVDWLPADIRERQGLLTLPEAIKKIHFPENLEELARAKRRLAWNELFLLQAQAHIARQKKKKSRALAIPFNEEASKAFVASLPFQLTDAQKKCAWQIIKDMEKNEPMTRLLEGDVGSGKTVVAALTMLNLAVNKEFPAQAALMAPTEILAHQHFESLQKLYQGQSFGLALMSRSEQKYLDLASGQETKGKKKIIDKIKSGEARIIVGTHAILQEAVSFQHLALAIIDEQHRFGVAQRQALADSSGHRELFPHLLSMTATPIPRSLALALFGDLDISIINELPKNRKKIITRLVTENKRQDAYDFVKQEIKAGRQAFVICPLIDISDKLGSKSVKAEFEKLDKSVFPDLRIAMLHGRMNAKDKETVMQDFIAKKTDILVATSVIEVGVDVPNASIMIIEDADRFGLAQLHQFRGRVGRSEHQSYCLLFAESENRQTVERLEALVRSDDGFALAQTDLKLRGPGEVFGTAQKGFPDLKVANLFDHVLIKQAQDEARTLLEKEPDLIGHPLLRGKLERLETDNYLAG